MSTNGIIARETEKGCFSGRYHHWDSYPSELGKMLYKLYHGHFNRDMEAMQKFLIDDHPAGWSTICRTDFSLDAGFNNEGGAPQCYCHGQRSEDAQEWTEEYDLTSLWVYILYDNGVISIRHNSFSTMIDLDASEPDWKYIESRAND